MQGAETNASETPAPSVRSLTERTLSGFIWTFTGAGAQAVLRLAIVIVLARLVTPTAFGLVSAALVVIAFSDVFGNLGVGAAIVQKEDLDERDISTGWMISVGLGLALGLFVFAAAPLIALAFRMTDLTVLVQALALIFPLRGIAVVSTGLLTRQMRFRMLSMVTLASYVFGYGAVSIALSAQGYGVWALVYGQLAQTALQTLAVIIVSRHTWRPLFSAPAARRLLGFGATLSMADIASFLALNMDTFVAGRQLGPATLAIYSRAYYFIMQPATIFGSAVDLVLFPAMSEAQRQPDRLRRAYRVCLALVAATTLPTSVGLVVLAPYVVQILLGPTWTEVTTPLQILSVCLLFRTGYKISDTVSRAKGTNASAALRNLFYAINVGVGAYAGSFWGVSGVATGVACAVTLHFMVMLSFATRLLGIAVLGAIGILVRYAALTVVMAAIATGAQYVLNLVGIASIVSACAAVVIAGGVYVACWWVLRRWLGPESEDLLTIFAKRIGLRLGASAT